MKRATTYLLTLLSCLLLLTGCSLEQPGGGTTEPESSKLDAIPFTDGAVLCRGVPGISED